MPYCSSTDVSNYIEYHQVISKECVEITPSRVSLRTRFTVVRVSKSNRKVISTLQQESLTTYTRLGTDELELESATKVFDDCGIATQLVRNQAAVIRAEPYTAVDSESGHNLRELFREFLISHRLVDLLPDKQ